MSKMSKLSFVENLYAQFKNKWWVFSYHVESMHLIKSEHETSSQLLNHTSTCLSQMYDDHESTYAYINNTQRKQLLNTYSTQDSQLSSSRQIPQFSSLSTSRTSWTQSLYLEITLSYTEKSLLYVNVKQFHRILKRRAAREQLRYTLEIRKSYMHESRSKHARRRSREFEEKFLTKDELKRKRKKIQNDTTDKCQTSKTKTESNISHVKKESVDWAIDISIKDEKEQQREKIRNDSQDEEIDESQVNQISNIRSEYQNKIKESFKISQAMTTSFYETTELEDLHKRFSAWTTMKCTNTLVHTKHWRIWITFRHDNRSRLKVTAWHIDNSDRFVSACKEVISSELRILWIRKVLCFLNLFFRSWYD